jgi:hypothetical protein
MVGKVYYGQTDSNWQPGDSSNANSYLYFVDATTVILVWKNENGDYVATSATIDSSMVCRFPSDRIGSSVTGRFKSLGGVLVFAYDDLKCTRESGTGLLGTWNVPSGQGGGTMTINDTTVVFNSEKGSPTTCAYTNENGFIVLTNFYNVDGYCCFDGQDLYMKVAKLVELNDAALIDEIKNAASSH